MSGRRAPSNTEIDATHLEALNTGTASARTLAEALAVDHTILLQALLPNADKEVKTRVSEAQKLGILKRMTRIGATLAENLDVAEIEHLAGQISDTVRGWVCFLHASQVRTGPAALLEKLRRFADDEHFAVREWAWMAARPVLVSDLDTSIDILVGWASDPSERVRRFASEALRPRGVWASHIPVLKQQPELGEPILHQLRADPSQYVQDSVSNWINDAAKTRPDWAIGLCNQWAAESDSVATARIVKRGLRSIDRSSAG